MVSSRSVLFCRLHQQPRYLCKSIEMYADKPSHRVKRWQSLEPEVLKVCGESRNFYGIHQIWEQHHRELIPIGRWTVQRIMKGLEIAKLLML